MLNRRMAPVIGGIVGIAVTAALSGCGPDHTYRSDPTPPATYTPTLPGPVDTSPPPGEATARSSPAPQTPTPQPPSGAVPEVCALVTPSDVGSVVHSDITTAKPGSQEGENTCDYDNTEGTAGVTIGIKATTEAAFENEAKNYPPVTGVGDLAYDDSVILYVLDGTFKISITAGGGDVVRTALARRVIDRLVSVKGGQPTS